MMKCYLVANVIVTDPGRFAEYREKVPAVIAQYNGQYVVRAGAVHPLAGELALQRMIMLEFASMDAARRFYESKEYAPLLRLRKETTQSQVAFVEALGTEYLN
ncbi:DUF1330 domain-containing protein [Burkholderia sp. WP9]|uniref:DUF1330 domain-containing protein n=1 Tax=Burkholderia sp. WP9 TaxID=1500263 RepID=UPI000B820559|nr:DUF1330 domain-containing protein [Burkholderia sp. WP9]